MKNEIKKWLYKNKPLAKFMFVNSDGITYQTKMEDKTILFVIPLDEIGTITYGLETESQLLLRWLRVEEVV